MWEFLPYMYNIYICSCIILEPLMAIIQFLIKYFYLLITAFRKYFKRYVYITRWTQVLVIPGCKHVENRCFAICNCRAHYFNISSKLLNHKHYLLQILSDHNPPSKREWKTSTHTVLIEIRVTATNKKRLLHERQYAGVRTGKIRRVIHYGTNNYLTTRGCIQSSNRPFHRALQ
jgi:hypothetical protein